ncbi:hypothetical protein ACYUFO_002208 [Vibrio parahaemolyticus]
MMEHHEISSETTHPDTDEITEYNFKCRKCKNAFFQCDSAGRRIFRIGKCKAKGKYIVSSNHVKIYECKLFVSLEK